MPVLTIGDEFPAYRLTALKGGDLRAMGVAQPDDYFEEITEESHPGKWRVVFFWPKDFTFVCPTEIAAFGRLNGEFEDRDVQILGVSGDNEFCHFQWRAQNEDLKTVPFPMLADTNRDLMVACGVKRADGTAPPDLGERDRTGSERIARNGGLPQAVGCDGDGHSASLSGTASQHHLS